MARRHLRRLRGLVMVLATLTTVVAAGNLPAAAAAAAVSVRYAASSSWLIGPYEWKTAVATCPAGTKVVGGGEDNSSTSAVLLQSSEPTADGNGWRVAVRNTGPAQLTYRAWAMCASGLTNYAVELSGEVIVEAHSSAYLGGICGRGPESMIGFGFHTNDNAAVGANAGLTYNWSFYFFEATTFLTNLSSAPVGARMAVICADGLALNQPLGAGVVARPGEAVAVTAICASDQILVGGGIAAPGAGGYASPAGPDKYLVDSQPLPIDVTGANTWRAIVYNSSTESNTIHAQALCAVT
jgi:hypothetical protein